MSDTITHSALYHCSTLILVFRYQSSTVFTVFHYTLIWLDFPLSIAKSPYFILLVFSSTYFSPPNLVDFCRCFVLLFFVIKECQIIMTVNIHIDPILNSSIENVMLWWYHLVSHYKPLNTMFVHLWKSIWNQPSEAAAYFLSELMKSCDPWFQIKSVETESHS